MTDAPKRKAEISPRNLGLLFALLFLFFLLLRNAEVAARLTSEGLLLCAKTVIPSLFPFLVLSELIVSGGVGRILGRLLRRPFHALFGVSESGSVAALLGILCGFPVGARCAMTLYAQRRIDREECEHLLCFSSTPSFPFLVGSVGISLFSSRAFGLRLCAVTLFSALLTGIGRNLLRRRKKKSVPPTTAFSPVSSPSQKRGFALFCDAVASSALSMLKISAFVVFFSALVGTLSYALTPDTLPPETEALLFGFFEMTGGVLRASKCTPSLAPRLAAAIVGFSGWSVHFQLMSLSEDLPLSFRPYLLAKLLQGLLAALLIG